MFRNDLTRRLEKIFGMPVTFDEVSDDYEQDKIFVEIEVSRSRVSGANGGLETARVVGTMVVYSQANKLPFGFFSKKIGKADSRYSGAIFFYDIDVDLPDSPARLINIHERRTSFVFLYNSQYDPSKGELNELDTTINFEV